MEAAPDPRSELIALRQQVCTNLHFVARDGAAACGNAGAAGRARGAEPSHARARGQAQGPQHTAAAAHR